MRRERTEVLIVGGGPAGLAAAASAASAGCAVRLLDDNPRLGGQGWRHDQGSTDSHRHDVGCQTTALLEAGVVIRPRTTVIDAQSPTSLWTHDDGHLVHVQADRVVLATGARELLLPFPGWTLPGVFGAGALQALAKAGLEVRGQRVVVAGTGPLLLAVAASLHHRGAEVVRVLEQAPLANVLRFGLSLWSTPHKLWQALTLGAPRLPLQLGSWVAAAEGRDQLQSVVVHHASGRPDEIVPCSWLACGFGLVPRTRLARLLGCAVSNAVIVDELQRTSVSGVLAAGESCGIGGDDKALVEGHIAGLVAAGRDADARALSPRRTRSLGFARRLARDFALRPQLRQLATEDTIVCRCEDVPLSAIRGHTDVREAKLASRCGMGPCQGRVCQPALEFLLGHGPDRPRPPLTPVPLGVLAELDSVTRGSSP